MLQRGFTIVEIIITITIMAILLALAVVGLNATQLQSRDSERAVDIEAIQSYLESYYINGISDATSIPTITNLITNPSLETSNTGFSVGNATMSVSTTWSSNGSRSLRVYPNSASNDSFAWLGCGAGEGMLCLGMQAGKTYTLSARQYIPTTLSGSLNADRAATIVIFQLVGGVYTPTYGGGTTTAGTRTVSVTATIDPAATEAFVRFYNGATNSASNYIYYDSIMLTEGSSTYNYADGNTASWIWNGTANISTSTGPAVYSYGPGSYPSVALASPDQITVFLRDADTKSFSAPGITDPYATFIPAINNTQTAAGVQPKPTKDTYVYQPIDSTGNICSDADCRKYNLYYLKESDNTVQMVTSKNQ